jgi:hypothetical protein
VLLVGVCFTLRSGSRRVEELDRVLTADLVLLLEPLVRLCVSTRSVGCLVLRDVSVLLRRLEEVLDDSRRWTVEDSDRLFTSLAPELRVGDVVLRCTVGAELVMPERALVVAGDTLVRLARTLLTRVLAFRTSSDLCFFADVTT